MSTQVVSTPVEQTDLAAGSPHHHLSSLTSAPRLSLDSQEMLPSNPSDVLLFSSSSKSAPAIHLTSSASNKRFNPVRHRTMSRSDEQVAASRRSAAIHDSDWHLGEFIRSISIADFKAGPPTRRAHYGSDLRRVLPSVPDLRNLAKSQDGDARNTERSLTYPPPVTLHQKRYVASNLHDEHVVDEIICNEKRLRRKFHYKSYQDLHILSMYQEDDTSFRSLASTPQTDPSSAESIDPLSASCSDSGSSRASSTAPKTPIDQHSPPKAENEKSRRAHARQVQVIEQRHEREEGEDEDEGEEDIIQMQATVIDRGRPRIVQIHRPQNSDQSLKQNIHHGLNLFGPTTPIHDQHETSSFSPYDTPASSTPFSDLSRTASEATPVPRRKPRLSIMTQLATLQSLPLTPTQRLPAGSTGTILSTDERERVKHLANPLGSPLLYKSSSFAQSSHPELTRSSTRATRSVSERSNHWHIYSYGTYEWKLDRAISLTTEAIEAHASQSFSLNSSMLSSFRTNRPGSGSDSFLVSNLNKIFMHSSYSLLSALSAWLIVDQHYTRLFDEAPPKVPSTIDNYILPGLDASRSIPPSRTATLVQAPWTATNTHSSQPRDTDKMSNTSVSSPLYTTKIPSKAASLLGINTDPTGCKVCPFTPVLTSSSGFNSATIEDQARSVHASIQEVGRNLVKKLIAAPTTSSPESIIKKRGLKMMHMPGRCTEATHGNNNAGPPDDAIDGAVKSLWEACRCVASTL